MIGDGTVNPVSLTSPVCGHDLDLTISNPNPTCKKITEVRCQKSDFDFPIRQAFRMREPLFFSTVGSAKLTSPGAPEPLGAKQMCKGVRVEGNRRNIVLWNRDTKRKFRPERLEHYCSHM